MKTQSNALLMGKLHKQIADIKSELTEKQNLYTAALKADEPFAEIKILRIEIKNLTRLLKQLEAQIIISNHLAEYSN